MIRLTHDGAVGVVTLSHPPHNLIGAEFIDRYCSAQEDAVAAGARGGPARAREITMLGRRYRPGTMATFGLDHPSVSAVNPRVVYVSMSATMLSVNERLHAEANDLDTLGEPTALSAPESPISLSEASSAQPSDRKTAFVCCSGRTWCEFLPVGALRCSHHFCPGRARRSLGWHADAQVALNSRETLAVLGGYRVHHCQLAAYPACLVAYPAYLVAHIVAEFVVGSLLMPHDRHCRQHHRANLCKCAQLHVPNGSTPPPTGPSDFLKRSEILPFRSAHSISRK
ncbi:hypothetical protein [Candidatus Poriferisodalis sp.]|uniref:hypothetical protein n=1 Tax=Candidatus Poriferisodalis sp. TaxID=3101277 RepID=UPI003B01205A